MASIEIDEKGLREAMRDPRYWKSGHPEREDYGRWVTDGWRSVVENGDRNGGVVQVKAYERRGQDGKVEHVRAHERGTSEGKLEGGSASTGASSTAGNEANADVVPLIQWIGGRNRYGLNLLSDGPPHLAAIPQATAPSDREREAANIHNPQAMSEEEREALYNAEILNGTSEGLHFPGGGSGVTLGAGYDMGQRSQAGIRSDLVAIGISSDLADRVSRAAGFKGADAAGFVQNNRDLIQITEPQQRALFSRTLLEHEAAVRRGVTTSINQNQFDAMVSLSYNIGPGNLRGSTLLRRVNSRDFSGAAGQFDQWVRSGPTILSNLVQRRARERRLFERPFGGGAGHDETNGHLNLYGRPPGLRGECGPGGRCIAGRSRRHGNPRSAQVPIGGAVARLRPRPRRQHKPDDRLHQ